MAITLNGDTGITTPGLTNTGTETLVNLTTTGNTTLGDASTDTLNVGNGGLIKDASGNVGVGVTPSAWGTLKPVQVLNASFSGYANRAYMGANWYYDATFGEKYIASDYATQYLQVSGQHRWLTAASGTAGNTISFTQAMTLDASGRLGLGTTSPTTPLQIQTAAATGVNSIFCTGSTTAYNFWTISNTTGNARIGVDSSSGGALATGSSAYSTVIGSSSATSLHLISNGTVRATIDTSGNLLVGTTNSALATANANIVVNGSSSSTIALASGGVVKGSFVFDGTSNVLYSNVGSTRLYCISNTGGVYLSDGSTAWAANSDERLKDIIEPIENATEKISNWRTVIGKYKTDEKGTRRSFLIAQDIQATFPEAVDASEPEKLGVQYSDLIPVLVKAIQEQQALITTLTDRITALEAK